MLPINVLYKLQVIKLNYHVKLGTEGEGVCVLNPKTNRCLAINHVKISDTRLGNRTAYKGGKVWLSLQFSNGCFIEPEKMNEVI